MKKILPYLYVLVLAACSTARHEEPVMTPAQTSSAKTGVETTGEVHHTDAIVQADEQEGHTTDDIVKMVKVPETPTELLQNMRFALEHHLLIKPEFYTDFNLTHLLGGAKVHWITKEPLNLFGTVHELGGMFDYTLRYSGEGVDFDLTGAHKYKKGAVGNKGYLGLRQRDIDIDVGFIKSILGSPTKITDLKSHGYPFTLQATNPAGNTMLEYEFTSAKDDGVIQALIFRDGTVYKINVREEEK